MIEFPQDMTVTQRTARLMEWLIVEKAEMPIMEIAERLGIGRVGVYRLVDRVSAISPNVVIEDGKVSYRDFSESE
jgi:hypothetical protein